MNKQYGEIKGPYTQGSIRERIEALFLDNIGKVITREQIIEVATDPKTARVPENWHQRLSELRTDEGYTILSRRDTPELKVSEYMMLSVERRPSAGRRIRPDLKTWAEVLKRADYKCEWIESDIRCNLREGEIDPVGGGTIRLTPDHKMPHSVNPNADPRKPDRWQALCGRHQVMKKNYWDDRTGWLNVYAIVQAASEKEKKEIYDFLKSYFGH